VRQDLTIGTVGTVREQLNTSAFKPGFNVEIQVISHNVSTRMQVTERTDTDGDGLWDAWENKTYEYENQMVLRTRT